MKSNVTAHPEAIMSSICDVMASLEAQNIRCKIMVMSSLCYACLLKEDQEKNEEDPQVCNANVVDLLQYGYIGTMWGSAIYIDLSLKSYDIDAYGGECRSLQTDHPDVFNKCQEIIEGP